MGLRASFDVQTTEVVRCRGICLFLGSGLGMSAAAVHAPVWDKMRPKLSKGVFGVFPRLQKTTRLPWGSLSNGLLPTFPPKCLQGDCIIIVIVAVALEHKSCLLIFPRAAGSRSTLQLASHAASPSVHLRTTPNSFVQSSAI